MTPHTIVIAFLLGCAVAIGYHVWRGSKDMRRRNGRRKQ
jgi:hypothetical protein